MLQCYAQYVLNLTLTKALWKLVWEKLLPCLIILLHLLLKYKRDVREGNTKGLVHGGREIFYGNGEKRLQRADIWGPEESVSRNSGTSHFSNAAGRGWSICNLFNLLVIFITHSIKCKFRFLFNRFCLSTACFHSFVLKISVGYVMEVLPCKHSVFLTVPPSWYSGDLPRAVSWSKLLFARSVYCNSKVIIGDDIDRI